jgi:hypothetical protein
MLREGCEEHEVAGEVGCDVGEVKVLVNIDEDRPKE